MIKGQKRGLSAIVATLLIILLTLVAVGIIWVVIRNVVQSGADQIEITSKCLEIDVTASEVIETSPGNYSVTLARASGGEEIGGVAINVFNSTTSSGILDFGVVLPELDSKTNTIEAGIINGNKIEYTVYFLDNSGNQQFCEQTRTLNF
jgi:flagellin-like protein